MLTEVSHKSQSYTDMAPFVFALLLTWQNRSGIEQSRRRNFHALTPSFYAVGASHIQTTALPSPSYLFQIPSSKSSLTYFLFYLIYLPPSLVLLFILLNGSPVSLHPTFSILVMNLKLLCQHSCHWHPPSSPKQPLWGFCPAAAEARCDEGIVASLYWVSVKIRQQAQLDELKGHAEPAV